MCSKSCLCVHPHSPRLHVPVGVDQLPPLHVVLMLPAKPGVQLVVHTALAGKPLQAAGKAVLLAGTGGNVVLQTTVTCAEQVG